MGAGGFECPSKGAGDALLMLFLRTVFSPLCLIKQATLVFRIISDWHKTARQLRLSASAVDSYASAFENPYTAEAKLLPRK